MSEFGEKACDERLKNCTGRMDSHGRSLEKKVPWRTFYWTLGIIIVLVFGSYTYTTTVKAEVAEVKAEVAEVVTKGDMEEYQKAVIDGITQALKGGK
jgi:hypothetical protein